MGALPAIHTKERGVFFFTCAKELIKSEIDRSHLLSPLIQSAHFPLMVMITL